MTWDWDRAEREAEEASAQQAAEERIEPPRDAHELFERAVHRLRHCPRNSPEDFPRQVARRVFTLAKRAAVIGLSFDPDQEMLEEPVDKTIELIFRDAAPQTATYASVEANVRRLISTFSNGTEDSSGLPGSALVSSLLVMCPERLLQTAPPGDGLDHLPSHEAYHRRALALEIERRAVVDWSREICDLVAGQYAAELSDLEEAPLGLMLDMGGPCKSDTLDAYLKAFLDHLDKLCSQYQRLVAIEPPPIPDRPDLIRFEERLFDNYHAAVLDAARPFARIGSLQVRQLRRTTRIRLGREETVIPGEDLAWMELDEVLKTAAATDLLELQHVHALLERECKIVSMGPPEPSAEVPPQPKLPPKPWAELADDFRMVRSDLRTPFSPFDGVVGAMRDASARAGLLLLEALDSGSVTAPQDPPHWLRFSRRDPGTTFKELAPGFPPGRVPLPEGADFEVTVAHLARLHSLEEAPDFAPRSDDPEALRLRCVWAEAVTTWLPGCESSPRLGKSQWEDETGEILEFLSDFVIDRHHEATNTTSGPPPRTIKRLASWLEPLAAASARACDHLTSQIDQNPPVPPSASPQDSDSERPQPQEKRQRVRRGTAPAPRGWMYLKECPEKYGQSTSTCHYWASKFGPKDKKKDEITGQVLVRIAAFEAQLKRRGRLGDAPSN